MGQSLVKNYLHIIFSTKHREPLIKEPVQSELYRYLGGICNALECYPIKIGGHPDHVHLLCRLSKKIALAKFLEEVKSHSSKWIKTKDMALKNFYWQNGYGAFSVNSNEIHTVSDYIENQAIHHQRLTFQEELKIFLKEYKVEYDERYIWD
jgi:putative transposase